MFEFLRRITYTNTFRARNYRAYRAFIGKAKISSG
jgi:hypothetical protein